MRILVATDGSPREVREAEVILMNVGQIPSLALSTPAAAGYVVDLAPLAEALEKPGQRVLDEAMKAFTGLDARVTRVYRSGDPSWRSSGLPTTRRPI